MNNIMTFFHKIVSKTFLSFTVSIFFLFLVPEKEGEACIVFQQYDKIVIFVILQQ